MSSKTLALALAEISALIDRVEAEGPVIMAGELSPANVTISDAEAADIVAELPDVADAHIRGSLKLLLSAIEQRQIAVRGRRILDILKDAPLLVAPGECRGVVACASKIVRAIEAISDG